MNVISKVVEKFGWPGAIVVCGAGFFTAFSSIEQKRYAIDVYLLGKARPETAVILAVVFVVVLLAQKFHYDKIFRTSAQTIRRLEEKGDRLTAELLDLKRQIESAPIAHTQPKKKGPNEKALGAASE